jgi:hypothetical protein
LSMFPPKDRFGCFLKRIIVLSAQPRESFETFIAIANCDSDVIA